MLSPDFTYDVGNRRTRATLGNYIIGVFDFDLVNRVTSIQHWSYVFDPSYESLALRVEHGYDAVGNRLFTRQRTPGLESRSELYEYDQRYRLRGMERGVISADPAPTLVTPLADDDLAAAQDWSALDRRGNWTEFPRRSAPPRRRPRRRVSPTASTSTSRSTRTAPAGRRRPCASPTTRPGT